MVGLKSCGYRSRSAWGRMLVSDAIAAGVMATAVNACKYTVATMRPDGSTRNSFPSGHTATAFLTATMLAKEYGPRSPWFAVGGYAAATVVALSRQLNNRHWMSDTVVGAGIGILAAEAGYLLADLIFGEKGLNAFDPLPAIGRYDRPSFCGIDLAVTTIEGRYAAPDGQELSFGAGAAVRAEGAWFLTPYLGAGGRLALSGADVRLGGRYAGKLETLSATAGLYLSCPPAERWRLGARVAAGWERSLACTTPAGRIGGRDGLAFGTGIAATCIAGERVGIRLALDYDLSPAAVTGGGRLHRLSLGVGVVAMF